MATILITGGSGLIGKAIAASLIEKGHSVIILTRQADRRSSDSRIRYAQWDPGSQTIDQNAIREADHLIHLAGAAVAEKRWTRKRKKEIVDSRVKSGELLVKAMQEIPNKIQTVVSASAIGWYGPDPVTPNPDPFKEDDPASDDFLGQTCKQWEASLQPVVQLGKRLVVFRIGIVLSRDGGALVEFLKPLRFGIASILGSGKQRISWIYIGDLVRLFISAMENEYFKGVYNAVTPHPVTNKELVLQLARSSRKNFYIPVYVPAFVLKLLFGEMSIEVLKSTTVSADKIKATEFVFQYPTLQSLDPLFAG